MRKPFLLTSLCFLFTCAGLAQRDTAAGKAAADLFARITKGVQDYQLDTTAAPDDKTTRKIKELRNLGGGFNIQEAIDFKLEEDRQKGEVPKAELEQVAGFFKNGEGKRWLDNAVTWIYRRHFTYPELKELVRFYRTSAGRKLAADFPVIMLQSLRAAEMIRALYAQQQQAAPR